MYRMHKFKVYKSQQKFLFGHENSSNNNNDLGWVQGEQPQQTQDGLVYPKSGKNHGGRPCQFSTNICYYCNREGHLATDCRKRVIDRASRLHQ